jgi:hypothetical protein
MSTDIPTGQQSVEGIRQSSTEEPTMSSHLQAQFTRIRRGAVAAAASLILASASVACASADHRQASAAGTLSPSALHVGATSRTFVTRMRGLEARGYVQIACTVNGALMFNPHTNRTESVLA